MSQVELERMDTYRKKLIEVALPLEAINAESAREKSIRHGHPSNLHLWWARRPLAACRAIILGQIVDDPGSVPEEFPTEEAQEKERQRLFRLVEKFVKWENSNNEEVLHAARMEIARSVARDEGIRFSENMSTEECLAFLQQHAPPVLDPFCGGGSIPLEAQRLGLKAYARDLNPVAVLITKALIEIPPKFGGTHPVNPDARKQRKLHGGGWKGAQGLAEDVRYYGQWIRDEAEKRVGHLYPKAKLPVETGGGEATVIAWLWARTVKCPNPACGSRIPLVKSFALSTKLGKEAWVEPIVDKKAKTVAFRVQTVGGVPQDGTVNRLGAICLVCESPVPLEHVRSESREGRMAVIPLAIVAEGHRGRVYLPPDTEHARVARSAEPAFRPEGEIADNPGHTNVYRYGLTKWGDLFTPRQLTALATFSDLVKEAIELARRDAIAAGLADDVSGIEAGGVGARAYAEAVGTYLAFIVDKLSDLNNSLCTWKVDAECPVHLFARQAIPMVWDFPESNPLSGASGSWESALTNLLRSMSDVCLPAIGLGHNVKQLDATSTVDGVTQPIVATDPPYYDNIGYADLADFFYVWLRRSLGSVYPQTCSTLLTPKAQELVAVPYRFGGDKAKAKEFFEAGLGKAFTHIGEAHKRTFPITLFYAFKQSENSPHEPGGEALAAASTGWETMLSGLLRSGFSVTGTWPVRSEMKARQVAMGTNALASSIVLVCRLRPTSAPMATRQQFIRDLKAELPDALRKLQQGSVAPVDLQQAAIGPGMAVFSRYAKILEAGGGVLTVRTALQIINQVRDEVLNAQETDLDHDTRWCVAWFKQYGMNEGSFGEAEVLSRAMNTAVNGLVEAGIVRAEKGKVRLLGRDELPKDYDPREDRRPTVWEATQQLIRALDTQGEKAAAELAKTLGSVGELAKELAYILFEVCNKRGWAQEAIPYNSLVVAWPEISRAAVAGGLEQFGLGV